MAVQQESNVSHRWARLVSSANEVKKYGHFVAHEDQVFFPQMVSCFWRDTWSLKALAVIPTCHLRNVCSCRKQTGRFYRQKFNRIFIYLSGNNCMWFLSSSLWFPKYANMSTINLYYFSSWKNVIEKKRWMKYTKKAECLVVRNLTSTARQTWVRTWSVCQI